MVKQLTLEELNDGLDELRQSPRDLGVVKAIVVRPEDGERKSLEHCLVCPDSGVQGDNWATREKCDADAQVTFMNSRAVSLIAPDDRWMLAGDQFYVDMDLSDDNLNAGQQIEVGSAVFEVTPLPHNGCKKFASRFGTDAVKFVNSDEGKRLHLRGINARIIRAGLVRIGDNVRKV